MFMVSTWKMFIRTPLNQYPAEAIPLFSSLFSPITASSQTAISESLSSFGDTFRPVKRRYARDGWLILMLYGIDELRKD